MWCCVFYTVFHILINRFSTPKRAQSEQQQQQQNTDAHDIKKIMKSLFGDKQLASLANCIHNKLQAGCFCRQ